jgi:platelet-activating factor acetylhydrolase IB subunit beta/gamma
MAAPRLTATLASLVLALQACAFAQACSSSSAAPVRAATPQPQARSPAKFLASHETIRMQLRAMPDADIVFIGDSITAHLSDEGRFDTLPGLAGRKALNLAVPGDQTENVLWRLDRLDLASLKPRQAVLLIGTNNLRGADTACDILAGIDAILRSARAAWPAAQLVVVGILPRGPGMQFAIERRREINAALRAASATAGFTFVDPSDAFLCGGGNACGYFQDDLLHLQPAGYTHYWSVLRPVLETNHDTKKSN